MATTINTTLAAGSVSTPYTYDVTIGQTLCRKTCASVSPSFAPVFTLTGYTQVGDTAYNAKIHAQGVLSYIPCCGGSCRTRCQVVSADFVLPFYSASAPSAVSITQGNSVNSVVTTGCSKCSNVVSSSTPLYLSVITT